MAQPASAPFFSIIQTQLSCSPYGSLPPFLPSGARQAAKNINTAVCGPVLASAPVHTVAPKGGG